MIFRWPGTWSWVGGHRRSAGDPELTERRIARARVHGALHALMAATAAATVLYGVEGYTRLTVTLAIVCLLAAVMRVVFIARRLSDRHLAIANEGARMIREQADALESRVTERTRDLAVANAELRHRALHDTLTALPNRALCVDRLDHALARLRRDQHRRFAVFFLDLDRFKVVNDSLGHPTGDELLTEVAERLRARLRPGDTVVRFGGDEFVLVVEEMASVADAVAVARHVQGVFATPVALRGHEVFVSASVGIAYAEDPTSSADALLRDADIAMYRAKAAGGMRHAVFKPRMRVHASDRFQVETELRSALERSQVVPHYQPLVSLATHEPVGFEALARWYHPEREVLGADSFIDVAEETGMIVPLGWQMLDHACAQIARMRARGVGCHISVNLSRRQLAEPDIVDRVEAAIDRHKIVGSLLGLEITETVAMHLAERETSLIGRLRDLGPRI